MEFLEIDEEEYLKFWNESPQKTFLSSIEIGKLRQKSGWNINYVGIKDNKSLVGVAMLTSHLRKLKKYEFYAPRGILVDYNNTKYLNFFIKNLKKYLKQKKAYVFRMDPYVINKQRDIDGNIVNGGVNNKIIISNLEDLGFREVAVKNMEQVGWMFSLDLKDKTEEEIMNEMKPNTRNTIKKTLKTGITIRELKCNELDTFIDIMNSTGERKNFSVRKLSYYQEMYNLFKNKKEIKYLVTELDLKKLNKKLVAEQKSKRETLKKLNSAKYNDGKRKALNNEIDSYEKKIDECTEIMKKTKKEKIILSGSMFIMVKPEIIYLSSGNYDEYMHFNSQYLLQWEMIKYGIENGFAKYNFYGIPANINTKPKDYGIYEFKRGFNGYVEELIGEYELPLSFTYYIFNIIHKIKRK